MTIRQFTADERLYMEEKKLKLPSTHDFQSDPQFKRWLKDLTNEILDGVFERDAKKVKENEEALRYLYKHPSKKLECNENSCIQLFKPLNETRFNQCRFSVAYQYNQLETREDPNKIFCNYFLNNITSLREIFVLLDKIEHDEIKPFKISFDCGFIVENTKDKTYTLTKPTVQNLGKTVPMVIRSPSDVQLYKHLVFSTLGNYTSEVHAASAGSQYHYVAIHTIFFQVTRMKQGGARVMIPGYDFLIKHKYIRDFGNENNLCMFHVVANTRK